MRFFEKLLACVYPENIACMVCGTERGMDGQDALCPDCRAALCYALPPLCQHCGRPFADGVVHVACSECQRSALPIWQARAPFVYSGLMKRLVPQYKYSGRVYIARFMAREMCLLLESLDWDPDCVLPVPLYRARKRKRGYNQAQLLAKWIARDMGLPLEDSALRRVRATKQQARLKSAERRVNLVDAFAADARVRAKRVLLIDDVYTTGETAGHCAQALQKAGAERVYVLTACTARAEFTVSAPAE